MGLELATFDLLPPDKLHGFARGFTAALVATVACYPLDTVRRRIQLSAGQSVAWQAAALTILQDEGVKGFYRGFVPNTLKNLPNKGVHWGCLGTKVSAKLWDDGHDVLAISGTVGEVQS